MLMAVVAVSSAAAAAAAANKVIMLQFKYVQPCLCQHK
jgi:hypothetical protein